jgi:phage terminase large subunit-like protein
MDLEESMEAYIKVLSRNFDIAEVRYDPFQFHRSATTLTKEGINMVEFPQTVGNLTDMGQCLFDAVKHQSLKLYADAEMRKEASFAAGKETPRGMRIIKEKSSHKIDAIIGLAMAVHAASTTPGEVEVWELPYATESGRSPGLGAGRMSENDRWLSTELAVQAEYDRRRRSFIVPIKKREIWDREWGKK